MEKGNQWLWSLASCVKLCLVFSFFPLYSKQSWLLKMINSTELLKVLKKRRKCVMWRTQQRRVWHKWDEMNSLWDRFCMLTVSFTWPFLLSLNKVFYFFMLHNVIMEWNKHQVEANVSEIFLYANNLFLHISLSIIIF